MRVQTFSVLLCVYFVLNIAAIPAYPSLIKSGKVSDAVLETGYKSVKDSVILETSNAKESPALPDSKSKSGGIVSTLSKLFDKIKNLFKKAKNEQYNAVVDELVKQSGLDRDVIEKAFSQLDKNQLDAAINLLSEMFKNNGNIISCGLYALGSALNIPAGEAAFLALITDIKIGAFTKKCLDENYTYGVSAQAQIEVMRAFGYKQPGLHNISLTDFMNSLKNGETAILYLDLSIDGKPAGGHVITVKKELNKETGKSEYTIFDNDKKPVTYTEEGFRQAITGGRRIDKNGNPVDAGGSDIRYNAVKNGYLQTVTASQTVGAKAVSSMIARENADIQQMLKNIISLIKR